MRARFHLPDFAGHFKFNLVFTELLARKPEFFREGVEIASVYGVFPPALWNGGRVQSGYCDERFIKGVLQAFNKRGIPLRFTFTNPMIEEQHLSDPLCNKIMQYADNGLNEVIVASPLLEDYIRSRYPGYKITSSTCKRITEPERLLSEVEKDYHIVVIDYDLNHDFETLEKIPDKKKCELLVNACCNAGCPVRSEHYRAIGKMQIVFAEHMRTHPNQPLSVQAMEQKHPGVMKYDNCPCSERTLFDITGLPNHISPEEIWEQYIPMGFEQFKIEGRSFQTLNLIEHYLYYMIRPEWKNQARYAFMQLLEVNDVLHFDE
ncbi:MAG: hypothetical protein MJ071_01890 [Oscillospiraceae bacterium]|nr:hypothetical protein [Oscillospiraceae bacterium]